jgi:hypothetical protein
MSVRFVSCRVNLPAMPDEDVSKRVVEQRLRNRVIEWLEVLADGDHAVRLFGVASYFEEFFDVVNDDLSFDWRENSAYTSDEVRAIDRVLTELKAASAAVPPLARVDEFITSGWPSRIQPDARAALQTMEQRGRFSEDVDQD